MMTQSEYVVLMLDNFHPQDPEHEYVLGRYESWAEAVGVAKSVIDSQLREMWRTGMNSGELYENWSGFGETPLVFVVGQSSKTSERFDSRKYAQEQCNALGGEFNKPE